MNIDEFIELLKTLKEEIGETYTIDFNENSDAGAFTMTIKGSSLVRYENLKIQNP